MFFDFLDLAERLKPKVIIAENVKGMIIGNAKGYTKLIMARLKDIGYIPQLFLINAANCGVPQQRERVFFCAVRNDLNKPALQLNPQIKTITVGDVCNEFLGFEKNLIDYNLSDKAMELWVNTLEGKKLEDAYIKLTGKKHGYFSHWKESRHKPCNTIVSSSEKYHYCEPRLFSIDEYVRLGSFPDDYSFESASIGKYMIGMSVPPKMTEQVAIAVRDQWLNV